LLAHDPEYARVTRNDLLEVGKRVRLKRNVELLAQMLAQGIDGHRFDFYVISAAPEEVVLSALEGIVPADHVVGTRFQFQQDSGKIGSLQRVAAGYGKVAAVEEIRARHVVPRDQVIYVGDGQSDIPVMLHVNRGDGFTIAASEAREIAQIAKRTVISDDALSVLVPILEEIAGFGRARSGRCSKTRARDSGVGPRAHRLADDSRRRRGRRYRRLSSAGTPFGFGLGPGFGGEIPRADLDADFARNSLGACRRRRPQT